MMHCFAVLSVTAHQSRAAIPIVTYVHCAVVVSRFNAVPTNNVEKLAAIGDSDVLPRYHAYTRWTPSPPLASAEPRRTPRRASVQLTLQ